MANHSANLHSIIDSIQCNIMSSDTPAIIYVGVGTVAGLTKTENDITILEDKYYHQFPPTLQTIFNEQQDVEFYCIYIDPILEKPVFITQDIRMKNKLHLNQWLMSEDEFIYRNTRINVYPLRCSIKVSNISHDNPQYSNDYLDITEHLARLNEIAINENILYVYHDFSGINDFKRIAQKFSSTIDNHLNHIIYGFGNGDIFDCYHDMSLVESQFAFKRENIGIRPIITVFNMNDIIKKYNTSRSNMRFCIFLLKQIQDKYDINMRFIIQEQIKLFITRFKTIFTNEILSLLRAVYKNEEIYINQYLIDMFGENIDKICSLYDRKQENNENCFSRIKKIIADNFRIELDLYVSYDEIINYAPINNLQPVDYYNLMDIITFETKPTEIYNWYSNFYNICKSLNKK
jgi:hypothetical protein